ncbi:MAG: YebC/PmpR family DNA-binding transcriptional regulator [Gloeomargaritaceae cyanobacterium C42_A2020_066]|nr:YebC/PmpR family DNA-binding transcriptional regulator [Gloeomargaritaceae cyanobacterium C42_A2020_066]
MAGHSKWAQIKRQKAVVDARRGQVFARLSREIIVAARSGLPDPDANFRLRTAIDKAKAAGVPLDNIERAIAKGAGTLGGDADQMESVRYEGYGPAGVALLIEALTDNRNRTAADLRAAFNKYGGNLGETGCVGWMFEQRGVITLAGPIEEDALLLAAAEAGAETYELTDDGAEVFAEPDQTDQVASALESQGYIIQEAETRWQPTTTTLVEDSDLGRRVIRLLEVLEDLEDVQSVTSNLEISDALLAAG